MKNTRYKYKVFRAFEFLIVGLLLLTILATAKEIVVIIINELKHETLVENYKLILSEILLLAVGVELAILIIKRDIYYVIDILILAIARKMITYESSLDIFVSIICIVILLVTMFLKTRFLPPNSKKLKKSMEDGTED